MNNPFALINPVSGAWNPRDKPSGTLRLSSTNKLTKKLFAAWPMQKMSNGEIIDLVRGQSIILANEAKVQVGAYGKEVKFDGSNDYGSVALDLSHTDAITLVIELFIPSYANDDALALEFTATTNSNRGFFLDPRSGAPASGEFQIACNLSAGAQAKSFTRPSVGRHTYVYRGGAIQGFGMHQDMVVDGITQSTTDISSGVNTDNFANDTLYLSSRAGTGLFGPYGISNLALFDYDVGDNAAVSLSRNSWQLYEPANIYIFPVGPVSGDILVNATTDALVLAENAATVSLDVEVSASTDALTLTENAAAISLNVEVSATTDALVLTEQAASVTLDVDISATTDALTLTEQAATIEADTSVQATTDALILTENAATVDAEINVQATTAALTLVEQTASVTLDVVIATTTDALILAEQAATVDVGDVNVSANTAALTLVEFQATVTGVTIAGNDDISFSTQFDEAVNLVGALDSSVNLEGSLDDAINLAGNF